MNIAPCEVLGQQLGAMFICERVGGYTRVRTPFLYPDGDIVDLFISDEGGILTVTDLGETTRWLRMQSIAPKRSPRQQKLIEDITLNHGVEFFRGMLIARAHNANELTGVIMRIGQAAVRTADIWFTMRTRSVESVTDEVEQLLTEKVIPFQRAQQIIGRSGRTWRPDFHIRVPQRSSIVQVLSTGSRAAANNVTNYVVAEFVDLSGLRVGPEAPEFIALFDDTMDVWSQENFNQLEAVSTIARWSRPDEFLQAVAA